MPTIEEDVADNGWTRDYLATALQHIRECLTLSERNEILDYVTFEGNWPDWVCEEMDDIETELNDHDMWRDLEGWHRERMRFTRRVQNPRERWGANIRRKYSDTFASNPYPYYVGVELETNESNVNKYVLMNDVWDSEDEGARWDCQHDGSLINGSEFALRQITNGDNIIREVSEFCNMLREYNYGTDDSCGVHVHIDFSEGNLSTLKRAVSLYQRYEPIIYEFVGADRIRKRYSKPLTDGVNDGLHFPPLREAMRTNNLRAFKVSYYDRERYEQLETYKYYDGRYFGTNIHSVFLNNTLELRHLEGTLDDHKINTWIMTNLALVDHCMKGFDPDVEDMVYSTNTPSLEEFCSLLPNKVARDFRELRLKELDKRTNETNDEGETWVDVEENL